jgi:hypothetical protein
MRAVWRVPGDVVLGKYNSSVLRKHWEFFSTAW